MRAAAPGPVVVAGDSAGGGLTLALLLNLREKGDPMPDAACAGCAALVYAVLAVHARRRGDPPDAAGATVGVGSAEGKL